MHICINCLVGTSNTSNNVQELQNFTVVQEVNDKKDESTLTELTKTIYVICK